MSNELEAARLAVLAAGQVGGDLRAWRNRVAELTPEIASMLRQPDAGNENLASTPVVTARKVLDSSVYRGTFMSASPHATNHRLMVKIKPDFGKEKWLDPDGCEEIGTEPGWTQAGFVMQKRIANLQEGTPILVYKYNEQIDDERKGKVLVHFEVLGRPQTRSSSDGGGPQPPDRAERQAPRQAPSPAGEPPSGNQAITDRFNALPVRQQIAFAHLCRTGGVTNFMDPDDEHLDQVLLNLSTIEKGSE